MATKKPAAAAQLRAAKLQITNLEERNEELHKMWTAEITEHARAERELIVASARALKLKGIIEYLEDQVKNGKD
jgi:hypothetical protein